MAATKKKDAAQALLTAAIAMPGMASGEDGIREEDVTLKYSRAYYNESGDRMKIDVDQLSITAPLGESFELSVDLTRDVTTGASPVLYLGDIDEEPIMLLQAGASIKDERKVFDIGTQFYQDDYVIGAKIGHSDEDDYTASYISGAYTHFLNQKNTALSFSIAQSNDEVWNIYYPSSSPDFDPFLDPSEKNDRTTREIQFAFDQVLNYKSRIQLALTYVKSYGDLDDPYKKVYIRDEDTEPFGGTTTEIFKVFGSTEALEDTLALFGGTDEALRNTYGIFSEHRPGDRDQWALLSQYSYFVEAADAAVHIDFRYSDDSWGSDSITLQFSWAQALPQGFLLTPSIRYYTQDNAKFYQTIFDTTPNDGHYSSDYRLAGFGATSYKLSLSKTFALDYTLDFHYEHYQRNYSQALSSNAEGTEVDDYKYDLISLGLSYAF